MANEYAVFAMKNNKPVHRQSIITSLEGAKLAKDIFWDVGQRYFQKLGYSLSVCQVNKFDEAVLQGNTMNYDV